MLCYRCGVCWDRVNHWVQNERVRVGKIEGCRVSVLVAVVEEEARRDEKE